jgi:hypothetical protein
VPLTELLGTLMEGSHDPLTQRAGILALGALGSPGGFRFLLPFVEPRRPEQVPVVLAVVEAAARMKAREAVPYLLAAVDEEETPVAAAALTALAPFAGSSRPGGQVVVDVADAVRRHHDDEPDATRPPPCIPGFERERTRYQTLSALLVERLNLWTGRDVARPSGWYALVDENRDHPEALFLR